MTETRKSQFDVVVIGAGIAGASVACELAREAKVLLLEGESQPGYHTTGRSAALFSESYGPHPIRLLSRYSRDFLESPPEAFADVPILADRGVLFVARDDQMEQLSQAYKTSEDEGSLRLIEAEDAYGLVPLLREGYVAGAMVENGARDIDVNALHHGYLRGFRKSGGTLTCNAAVRGLLRKGDCWTVETAAGAFEAPVVVNAAGAWVDEVAVMAGIAPIGIIPKRRTAIAVDIPDGIDVDGWPMVVDVEEQFYLKPDAGRFLVSPADATPTLPCDVQPEELDVAICIDRIETAFDLKVGRVVNKWAGLRNFVEDGVPVCGYDPQVEGFFWLAGQGGYGIQSAPGLSQAAAALLMGRALPARLAALGFREDSVSPRRLERSA